MEKIAVIGLGKLGLCWALLLANNGYDVVGIDIDNLVVEKLRSGECHITESGIEDLLKPTDGRIQYSSDINHIADDTKNIFIVVPTPSLPDSRFDSSFVQEALKNLCQRLLTLTCRCNIVITSTVMPGECDRIVSTLPDRLRHKIEKEELGFCYNPEFIALGQVLKDMLNPDFILIGSNSDASAQSLESIYRRVNGDLVNIQRMSLREAEIVKISINTFLTLKISFANSVGLLCNAHGIGNSDLVTNAIGLDTRIGGKYLKAGLGFGGPCLPRDTRAFTSALTNIGIHSSLSRASKSLNDYLESKVMSLVLHKAKRHKAIAFIGLSYKKGSWLLEDSHPFAVLKSVVNKNIYTQKLLVYCYDSSADDIVKNAREWQHLASRFTISGGCLSKFLHDLPESTLIVQCHELSCDECEQISTYLLNNPSSHLYDLYHMRLELNDIEPFQTHRAGLLQSASPRIVTVNNDISASIYAWFMDLIGTRLEDCHTMVDGASELLTRHTDQSTSLHQSVYKAFDNDCNFRILFESLVADVLKLNRISGERVIVQTYPSVRFQFPGNISVYQFHQDSHYNHPCTERNIFYAVTDCIDTSALWIANTISSADDDLTFEPLNLKAGQAAQLNTTTAWHGDVPNLTQKTRVSLDFRILNEASDVNGLSTHSGKRRFEIGSYYRYFDTSCGVFI
jgi:UDPglucose 6-dehydrogenase